MTKRMHEEIYDLKYVSIEGETEKAWFVVFDNNVPPIWLPKSKCELYKDDHVIVVPAWLVEEKDLDGYVES